MSETAIVVQGILKDNGTLELDERPMLSPGRVQVMILPIPAPAEGQVRRSLVDVLDEIHAGQRARGYLGRSIEEMEADEEERRASDEDYEKRWRTILSPTTSVSPSGETKE